MENLKVAVIGTGFMGKKHLDVLKNAVNSIVICSTDEKTGKELAKEHNAIFYTDYREMFEKEKLDFVSVCLPTNLHYEITMYAFEHGVNVLCEKPFASTYAQAEEMVKTAQEKNLLLMVGHCCRFSKLYEYLKHCIDDNRFGKLKYLNLFRHSERPLWSVGGWLADMKISGGVVMDLHIHDTDLIYNFLGAPQNVYTTGDDYAISTTYTYPDNISATTSGSWRNVKDFPFTAGYDAVFDNASVIMVNDKVTLYTDGKSENPIQTEEFSEFFASDEMMENEIKYFCHCVANKYYPEICPPTDSLKALLIGLSESKSLNENSTIKIG